MRSTVGLPLLCGMMACLFWVGCKTLLVDKSTPRSQTQENDFYTTEVQPILDRRCSVCHSCYTAPCQLITTSFAGVDRGMSRYQIFGKSNVSRYSRPLTRLFVDQKTTEKWQTTKPRHWKWVLFSPVLKSGILQQVVNARRSAQSAIAKQFVPSAESHVCPTTRKATDNYLGRSGIFGMPYNFPPLSPNEYAVLDRWFRKGMPGPTNPPTHLVDDRVSIVLKPWRERFNEPRLQSRIASRYLYEHLSFAHIQFPELPAENYRLVRSKTAWPVAVDEIATERSIDDPGRGFYYRFLKVTASIVEKNHVPFQFSAAFMTRIDALFYRNEWPSKALVFPSWERAIASNPFKAFAAIPVRSRYQFMLENALYMVNSFIRGPVCTGQIATNVLRDHFWAVFVDPNADVAVNSDLLTRDDVLNALDLPARQGNKRTVNFYPYRRKLKHYTYQHAKTLARLRRPNAQFPPLSYRVDDLWHGQEKYPHALLTVDRHFDSASVRPGHVGRFPKSIWLVDYVVFERIWYSLVAGFSVYGNIFHGASTRRYMDSLRVESEDLFFSMLPGELRRTMRGDLYRKFLGRVKMQMAYPYRFDDFTASPLVQSDDQSPTMHLMQSFWQGLPTVVLGDTRRSVIENGVRDFQKLDRPTDDANFISIVERMSRRQGKFIAYLHDVSFIKIEGKSDDDLVLTLLRHEEHYFMNWMMFETKARQPENDAIDIVQGLIGSYPNYFYRVKFEQLGSFFNAMQILTADNVALFRQRYGVDRMDPNFWQVSDFFNQKNRKLKGAAAGILDLSRYQVKRNLRKPKRLTKSEAENQRAIAIELGLDAYVNDANDVRNYLPLQGDDQQLQRQGDDESTHD